MRIFIATSDSSSYILKPFAWLMDKYLPEFDEIIILGYGNFPERYMTVSLTFPKQDNISEWYTLSYYFTNIDDKYMTFLIYYPCFGTRITHHIVEVWKLP